MLRGASADGRGQAALSGATPDVTFDVTPDATFNAPPDATGGAIPDVLGDATDDTAGDALVEPADIEARAIEGEDTAEAPGANA